MIDLHIHLLPGIDDGPADVAGTVELARACVADGVQAVAATPHVSAKYQTTPARMRQGVEEARIAIKAAGVPLKVYAGAEVAIDQMARLSNEDLRGLTLGPTEGFILLETPYAAWPMELETQVGRLAMLGIRGILAHPERSAGVQGPGGIEKLERAVSRGLYTQVTAGSLVGRFGRTARNTANELLQRELVHVISSDSHNVDRRPPRMAEAAADVGDPELAKWLTTDAPLAIVRGERLPPRPTPRDRPSGGLFGRGRRG
ncbi:MAG: tyrosine protein phosphatase [Solirubrobacterales bacterium]|nr:tyrosine protein phosphatase [Solirubrobacterales bacterium]